MSPVYRKSLLSIGGLALLALASGAMLGAAWGWALFAVAIGVLLVSHLRHLARLERWAANPLPGKVPEGEGLWQEVLDALHRLERDTAKREQGLAEALTRMRRAMQALPDGVIILDREHHIEWFNRTA